MLAGAATQNNAQQGPSPPLFQKIVEIRQEKGGEKDLVLIEVQGSFDISVPVPEDGLRMGEISMGDK
ncbi:hypothetical protein HDU91_003340, partial [Kappamyces sp. JEL0680]